MDGSGIASMTGRSVTVFTVTLVFFIVATIFVSLRMASRVWIVKRVGLDDYLMVLAWFLAFGIAFTICYGSTVGLGRHETDVPDSWQVHLKSSQYAFSILYQPALMAQKASILVFYLSLSQNNRVFKWACILTLAVVLCGGFALTIFTAFQCHPPSAAYRFSPTLNASCTNILTIYLSSSPLNIISDLALLVLPMPILTGMRLPLKQKIIIVVTFSFGLFVAVVDVIRISQLQSADTYVLSAGHHESSNNSGEDFSWYASYSFMWTAIEVNLGIMCACVPGLKPLVARFAPHFIMSAASSKEPSAIDNTASMIQRQRVPSMQSPGFGSRDFPSLAPLSTHEQSTTENETEQVEEMNFMEFLTMPDMSQPRSPGLPSEPYTPRPSRRNTRRDTMMTHATAGSRPGTPGFFDFVNMQGRKSMVQLNNRESVLPVTMVTLLFFIWGFEYGLLDTLNKQFQAVAGTSQGEGVALHSAYFAGYFAGPLLIGRFVLKAWGFKACYLVGLSIYACGTLIFWVAAVLTSFPAYVIVNFIVGVGLSILENGANPFISLCGPAQYAEIRLNLSQGFQAIGTVIAPLIADKTFARYTNDGASLINTQWAYLGIAFFTCFLAFAYYYVPLPEATDAELEDAAERVDNANHATLRGSRVIWYTLGLGILTQFCYVGGQEVYGTSFGTYMQTVRPGLNTADFMAIAHTAFAISRFSAAGLGFFVKPRYLLIFYYSGCIVFSALTTAYTGGKAVAFLVTVLFFEGPIFSLIYAQTLRGQGRHAKTAASLITAATSGGAVWPAIEFAVERGYGVRYALVVGIAAFAFGIVQPLVVSAVPSFRLLLDPISNDTRRKDSRKRGTSSSADSSGGGNGFGRTVTFGDPIANKKERPLSADGSAEFNERHGSAESSPSVEGEQITTLARGGEGKAQ